MIVRYTNKYCASVDHAIRYGLHALCLDEVDGKLLVELNDSSVLHPNYYGDSIFDGIDEYEMRLFTRDLTVVFHELVHVMQYSNYELELYTEGHGYWQGSLITTTYGESPWEVEAFDLESKLLNSYMKSN